MLERTLFSEFGLRYGMAILRLLRCAGGYGYGHQLFDGSLRWICRRCLGTAFGLRE